jgi:SAM-dependent methyltransferase
MFGLGGEFWYDRCGSCGGLQIRDVPSDLAPYYPENYYAFGPAAGPLNGIRGLIRLVRDALVLGRGRHVGRCLEPLLSPGMLQMRGWLERAGATRESRILDVGCGKGAMIRRLADHGYSRVFGVDPYIDQTVLRRGRPLVLKGTVEDVSGEWDAIMLHHSLEHIEDQRGTMAQVARRLAPDGCVVIRVPIVSSDAWEEYRDRWVQLDAPRHLFLHSHESMKRLARTAGLRVDAVVHDSTALQFEGSELYRRDRPLSELTRGTYSRAQHRDFSERARQLNAQGRGDQAAFYLRRA